MRLFAAFVVFASLITHRLPPRTTARRRFSAVSKGRNYVSPTGAFKVAIPVLPELGGTITDTENVVTFQDDFNVHISIAAFSQDATQRLGAVHPRPEGLSHFLFSNYVLADFKQAFEGVSIESAKFVPGMLDWRAHHLHTAARWLDVHG